MAKKRRARRDTRRPVADAAVARANAASPNTLEGGHPRRILVLLLVGFGVAAYLTYVHYRLHETPGWRSACDVDPAVSCDDVVLSPYGSVRGLPLSIVAAWFYGAAIVFWLRRTSKLFHSYVTALFIGAIIAAGLSIVLGVISVAVIGSLCLLCAVLYVINIALTAATWRAVRRTGHGVREALRLERAHWKGKRWLAVGVAALAIAPLALTLFIYSQTAGASIICDAIAKSTASGEAIEVVTYSDFQCRHCRDLAKKLRSVPHDGAIRFVSRHYPLDQSCNPHAKRTRHPGSCRLAIAAICGELQGGRSRELADALFEDPSSDQGHLVRLAVSLGMNGTTFEACLSSGRASALLRTSIESAAAKDVDATPTLFINGRRRVGRLQPAEIECLERGATTAFSSKR